MRLHHVLYQACRRLGLTEPALHHLERYEHLQRVDGLGDGLVDGQADGLAVSVSIGLTQAPPYEAGLLYALADQALYRAKQAGRNQVSGVGPR